MDAQENSAPLAVMDVENTVLPPVSSAVAKFRSVLGPEQLVLVFRSVGYILLHFAVFEEYIGYLGSPYGTSGGSPRG